MKEKAFGSSRLRRAGYAKAAADMMPRLVDRQGRVVLPKEVLEALDIHKGRGYVAFEIDGQAVRMRRVEWKAIWRGEVDGLC